MTGNAQEAAYRETAQEQGIIAMSSVYDGYGNAAHRETGNAVNADLISEFYSAPDAAAVLRKDASHRKWKSRKKSEAARQASLESRREAETPVQDLYPEDAGAVCRERVGNGAGYPAHGGAQEHTSAQAQAYGNGQAYVSFLTPEQRMEREAYDAETAGNLYEGTERETDAAPGGPAAGAGYAGYAPQGTEQAGYGGHAHHAERTAERQEAGDAARAESVESFGATVRRLRTELTEAYRRARREKDEAERHIDAMRKELNNAVTMEAEISHVLGEYGEQIKKAAKAEGWGEG